MISFHVVSIPMLVKKSTHRSRVLCSLLLLLLLLFSSTHNGTTTGKSVRRFLPTPVDEGLIARIIDEAKKAPSGGNLQPWKVYVLVGDELDKLRDAVGEKINGGSLGFPSFCVFGFVAVGKCN